MISVVVPVGPYPANRRWLKECLESLAAQYYKPYSVVVIDDMAHLSGDCPELAPIPKENLFLWHSPWRLGVAHAFNIGVAIAPTECVFMLGSDDTLEPDCLGDCMDAYNILNKEYPLAYYYVGVRYSDGRPDQYLPCHAAMVTKALWKHTGGLPVEAASGASDAALISILLGNGPKAGQLLSVNPVKPLYNYRVHDETDTAGKGPWQGVILETRNILTSTWRPPEWTSQFYY